MLTVFERKVTLQDDLQTLVEKAMELPGVADVMQAYAKVERVVTTTRPYLLAAKLNHSFVVADTSSQ